MTTDIILAARKASVLSGLDRVSDEVKALQRQRQELDSLKRLLSASDDQVEGLAGRIEVALAGPKAWVRNPIELGNDQERMQQLAQKILDAVALAEQLGEKAREAKARATGLESSWQLPMTSKGAVRQLCAQADVSRGLLKACDTWDAFHEKMQTHVQPVFDEHLDLLEGAAFRIVGYDDGVAQDADELLLRLDKVRSVDGYLAIPSRSNAVREVVARLVRMGFPGWSFWNLPLIAYEFGHLVALHENVAQHLVQTGLPHTVEWRETVLADAFALYAIGPAYPIAAVMLSFDPRVRAGDVRPSGTGRVHLLLKQLEGMSGPAGQYASIAADLRTVWKASAEAEAEAELEVLDNWGQTTLELLHDELEINRGGAYPESQWNRVVNWPRRLLQPDPSEPIVTGDKDIIDHLNVAWVARLRQPDRVGEIFDAVSQLRKSTPEGRQPGLPRRGG